MDGDLAEDLSQEAQFLLDPSQESLTRAAVTVALTTSSSTPHTPPPDGTSRQSMNAIVQIEAVFERMSARLLDDKEIYVDLKSRKSTSSQRSTSEGTARRICFPGKTAEEAWRFSEWSST